MKTIW